MRGANPGTKGLYFWTVLIHVWVWGHSFPFLSLDPLQRLHPGGGGGEKGGVFLPESRFGRRPAPIHRAPHPPCHPSPRVAPGGHNKRLASLFQLVANRVA